MGLLGLERDMADATNDVVGEGLAGRNADMAQGASLILRTQQ